MQQIVTLWQFVLAFGFYIYMVIKVGNVSNVYFRGDKVTSDSGDAQKTFNQIERLGYVTPDFDVKTPQKYTKLGTYKLDNGLEIYSYKLANGYKVTIVPMKGSPSVVKSYVNVGSMNETANIKGISHFLEHMAFNGTNGENGHLKLYTGDSFKKIDELGGWANASTNYAITDYVNSAPLLDEKDLETQIKVIASMAEDLKLSEDMIKKEKGPVSSEINMILDNPQTIAMDQTVRTLFNIKNPADEMVGGSVKHIQNLTRKDVLDYYNKYYTPENTNIVITGDVDPDRAIALVSKNFISNKTSKGKIFEEKLRPIQKTVRKDFISDKATSSEIILGFAGAANNNTREKVLYDLASAYVMSQNSGLYKNLKQYNTYPVFESEKISTNPNSPRLSYIAMSTSDENTEKVLETLYDSIIDIKPITQEYADKLKQKIKNGDEMLMEHSLDMNTLVGNAVLDGNLDYITDYNQILDSITPEEINQAVKKFFDLNKTAITVIHPKNDNKNISFKGRKPIDMQNVENKTMNNNYDLTFVNTNSRRFQMDLNLIANEPYTKNPGVSLILNKIYSMGIGNLNEDEFNSFKDNNNLAIHICNQMSGLKVHIGGDANNYKLGLAKLDEMLNCPRINEENVEKAKNLIKDEISRKQKSAAYNYAEYISNIIPYGLSDEEILENIDKITVSDIKDFHKYLLNNSRGIVAANLPSGNESEIKNDVTNVVNSLASVEPNDVKILNQYVQNETSKVLTQENTNSQADIVQAYTFKTDNSKKEIVTGEIMNSILSSSSIGLFDILREKENLAYSVHSEISRQNDLGEVVLNILTTTDNKNIGEQSYDNVQKSINGFHRQINELVDGHFSEQDLENAKRSLKAKLLNQEGIEQKINSLKTGVNSIHGINYINDAFAEIDKITKDDVISFAHKVFDSKPIYSVAASKDTLTANKEFLEELEN